MALDHDSPDRATHYTRSSNEELLRSLNEAWKTIRLNERAIAVRDEQIHNLYLKLEQRDRIIERMQRSQSYRRIKVWVLGLAVGGQWAVIVWLANTLLGMK